MWTIALYTILKKMRISNWPNNIIYHEYMAALKVTVERICKNYRIRSQFEAEDEKSWIIDNN
jgi:hypothetical protein